MNSATVSPPNQQNKCHCGHGYGSHSSGTPATAQCTECGHFHQFTGEWESEPAYAFPQDPALGYISISGTNKENMPDATITTTGGGNTAGATTVTVSSTTNAVPGGLIGIRANAQMEFYKILRVLSATTLLIPAPGLTFTAAASAPCVYVDAKGTMQGPGRGNPYQRGG